MKILINIVFLLTVIIRAAAQIPDGTTIVGATPVATPSAYTNSVFNYIRIWEPAMPVSDPSVIMAVNRTPKEVRQVTQYFDGLGRPLQTVTKGISGTADINASGGKDLVTPLVYDAFGREQYKYLPYAQQGSDAGNGEFKIDPFNAQKAFYQNSTLNPGAAGESVYYSKTDYDGSPLNRISHIYAPGNSWAKNDLTTEERGSNRPIQQQYLLNSIADSVHVWDVVPTSAIPVNSAGRIYAAGELYRNMTIDEAGDQSVEYKNKEDRVVMRKVQLAGTPGTAHMGWLCTYYVYDISGNLRFVIPPKAVEAINGSWSITTAIAAELCFIYRYDDRNRMIIKKIPGADSTEMIYDIRDRLVLTRDGHLKGRGKWLVYFYDGLDRATMTALYTSSATRITLQGNINNATSGTASIPYTFPGIADLVLGHYDGSSLYQATNSITLQSGFDSGAGAAVTAEISPVNGGTQSVTVNNPLPGISANDLTPLTYTFYDDYNYTGKLAYVNGDINKPQAGSNPYAEALPATASNMTRGLITGMKIKVLETGQWLTATIYYNDKGREIQKVVENASGGKDIVTSLYDFNGKLLSSYLHHTNPRSGATPEITVLTNHQYDHGGRLVSIKKRLNDDANQERTIVENSYDELGRLKRKRLGVTGVSTQLDDLNYEYNIRSWLKSINKAFVNTAGSTSNWFGQELSYDYGFTSRQYNGNISGAKWKSRSDGIPRAYGYGYDKANRLTLADFSQQNSAEAAWTKDKVDFSVNGLSYDANGNIGTMTQKGMNGIAITTIDQLTYTYRSNSNKLLAVVDPTNTTTARLGDFINGTNTGFDYRHDTSGNLIQDLNKGIDIIRYNHLNLPDTIVIAGKGIITHQYDAAGTKLRKTVTDNTVTPARITVTDYIGGTVYENDTLQFIGHEEGRIRSVYKSGQPIKYAYDYFEKDHLGNIRVVLGTQTDTSIYAATMETAATEKENALFSNIDATRSALPSGYPADATTNPNAYVSRLNAVNGAKIGPSLVLRVMAGDTVQLGVKAFYKSTGTSTASTTPDNMLAAIVSAFSYDGGISDGTHVATGANSPIASNFTSSDYSTLKTSDPSQNLSGKPKAYLNYALFDDRFQMVNENSGVRQVQGSPDELQTLSASKAVIKKSGFIYIYTSNESGEDVFLYNQCLSS